jgi:hypothetical protein
MPKSADVSSQFISHISLTGHGEGRVKALTGFKKQHHTLPDAVNATTTAFLGKLCVAEITAEAEDIFQRAKTLLNYKRADLTLEVTSPTAQLVTKNFGFDVAYALEKAQPDHYRITRTLHSLRDRALVDGAEFDQLFADTFSGIVFGLTKGIQVESVIDAVEALDDDAALKVDYPSTCQHCMLTVQNVETKVVCDGATLEMRFPKKGSPRELIEAFARVRRAFALTKDQVLAGLL